MCLETLPYEFLVACGNISTQHIVASMNSMNNKSFQEVTNAGCNLQHHSAGYAPHHDRTTQGGRPLLRPGGLSTPHAPVQRLHACALRFLTSSTPHHCGSAPPFYPRDPLLPCGTWRHPCGALEAPRRRPCDALATPLRHLASLLAPHPLPAPSRRLALTLSLYLDCSVSVAAP